MTFKYLGSMPLTFNKPILALAMGIHRPGCRMVMPGSRIPKPGIFRRHLCANCHPQCHLRHGYTTLTGKKLLSRSYKRVILEVLYLKYKGIAHIDKSYRCKTIRMQKIRRLHVFWGYARSYSLLPGRRDVTLVTHCCHVTY